MTDERYINLLTKISNQGLDNDCAVEVMAWHNQTGKTVKQLCGLPEKIVLQRLIESYLSLKELKNELKAENAALRNEADTNAANAIQAKLRADELEAALFTVVRNSMVMPVGLRLGKSEREIAEMTFATIEEIKKAIDYEAVKKLMERKDE